MPAGYPLDFVEAWQHYKNPKNASKSMAYSCWMRIKDRPDQALFIACIKAYNSWLDDQTKRNGREYPKCHMATWLRQRRWESFLDDAEAIIASEKAVHGRLDSDGFARAHSWEGPQWDALQAAAGKDGLGPNSLWILQAAYISSQPPEIRSPSKFHAEELEKRFGRVLRKAFPDVRLTYVGQKNPPGD